jgi:hypothetical protein
MNKLAGSFHRIERGLCGVLRTENLPCGAGPGGLRHPKHPTAVGFPEMGVEALENSAVVIVVQQLRFLLEVFEASAGTKRSVWLIGH